MIPESIGGALIVPFLCATCNSRMGTEIDASAVDDVSIQLAAMNLREQIPTLAQAIVERHLYVARGQGPSVTGRVREGTFHVVETRLPDDSIIQRTARARRSVATILVRQGRDDDTVRNALRLLDSAPDNARVRLDDNLEIVRWNIDRLEPLLSSQMMSDLFPLKIAYEFLALHLGSSIYEDTASLAEIRNALRGGQEAAELWRVEHFHATYDVFHGIALAHGVPNIVVKLRLFGWLAFDVHFPGLAWEGPRAAYTQRLESGAEQLSRIG